MARPLIRKLSLSPKAPLLRVASVSDGFPGLSPHSAGAHINSPLTSSPESRTKDRLLTPHRTASFRAKEPIKPRPRFRPRAVDPSSYSESPGLSLKYCAPRSCEALIQSPCRADDYSLQRRRLYHCDSPDPGSLSDVPSPRKRPRPYSTRRDSEGDASRGSPTFSSQPTRKASAPPQRYVGTPKLGKGGFGSVFIGKYDGKKAAIKQLYNRSNQGESLCKELEAFRLSHPNIVKIWAFTTVGSTTQIVYEFVGSKNLQTILNDSPTKPIDFKWRKKLGMDLASALGYCHMKGVMHLDVKPTNIILTEDGSRWKLCDFGCCQRISAPGNHWKLAPETPSSAPQAPGTLLYKAPEILRGMQPTSKADVYSFALVMWQTMSRKLPFTRLHPHATVFLVVSQDLRPDCSFISEEGYTSCDVRLLHEIQRWWDPRPDARPEFPLIYNTLLSILDS